MSTATGTTISLEQRMLGRSRWSDGTGGRRSIVGRVRARRFGRLLARLDLDRKTVRRCLRQTEWPYERAARSETLLTAHAEYLRRRASAVDYSAQLLFQELRRRRCRGSYETVEAVRAAVAGGAVARGGDGRGARRHRDCRARSTGDRGPDSVRHTARVATYLRADARLLAAERLRALPERNTRLDAHEQVFSYFGGHTQEHLYDRPRTVCEPRDASFILHLLQHGFGILVLLSRFSRSCVQTVLGFGQRRQARAGGSEYRSSEPVAPSWHGSRRRTTAPVPPSPPIPALRRRRVRRSLRAAAPSPR